MSRKILSLIVAVAFVLTTISTAFAATLPSDVTGDAVKAVSEMQSLNIMIGDAGTGLFRPNDTIKRSEFAVVAVKAMGLNDTAIISAGATKFSDVAADNWASGYINAAVGAGLISGYPDGTYKPDNTINYAEAVTILANMLGYGPVLIGKPWPAAYVAQANASGITTGVVMAPTVGASRGNVAKLVSNTLAANELQISGYDVNGKPTYATADAQGNTKTLMSDKLSVTQITDKKSDVAPYNTLTADNKEYQVIGTPEVQNGATVGNSTLIAANGTGIPNKSYGFAAGLNPNDYDGLNINAWYNSDGNICVAQIVNNASDIYQGTVIKNDATTLKLDGKSASYGFTSDFRGYLNGATASAATILVATANDKATGRVVLSNGLIKFASLWAEAQAPATFAVGTDASYKSNTYVISDITDGYVNSINSVQQAWKLSDLTGDVTNQTAMVTVIKDGVAATLDDLKAGDVVTEVKNGANYNFMVSSKQVTGTLSAISGSDDTSTLTIGGTGYTIARQAIAQNDGTITDAKAFSTFDTASPKTQTGGFQAYAKGAMGTSVTVTLNAVGQIAYMGCTSSSATYYYGIVRSIANNVGANLDYGVTLYKSDATKVSYVFDNDSNISGYDGTGYTTATLANATAGFGVITQGDLVQYQLTSAGKIKDGTMYRIDDVKANPDGYYGTINHTDNNVVLASDITSGDITHNAGSLITSGTVIFDNADLPINHPVTAGDTTVLSYSTISGANKFTTAKIFANSGIVKAIVVSDAGLAAGTNGVVVDVGFNADGTTVTVNENGTAKTYETNDLSSTARAYLASGIYAEYNVGSDGKIKSLIMNDSANTPCVNGISSFDLLSSGPATILAPYGTSSTRSNLVKVISVDTVNHQVKYEHIKLDGTYAADGNDLYFRYDPADLNVYDVTDKGNKNIVGGKDISAVKAGQYIWIGGASDKTYDVSRILIVKIDDIQTNGAH